MIIKRLLQNKSGWQRGALIGLIIYFFIAMTALAMCFLDYIGLGSEGCEAGGWTLVIFGFPASLLEITIAAFNPSFFMQIFTLFILTLVQYIIGGAIIGYFRFKKDKTIYK
jgi:hypothetical protein